MTTRLEKIVKQHYQYRDKFPQVRMLSKLMRVRQSEIIELAEDSEVLDVIVGIRSGNGIGEFENIGDYQIEYYGEEE